MGFPAPSLPYFAEVTTANPVQASISDRRSRAVTCNSPHLLCTRAFRLGSHAFHPPGLRQFSAWRVFYDKVNS